MWAIGKVWFNEDAMANVLSFALLMDDPNFDLDFDKANDAFVLKHIPTDKTIRLAV